MKYTDYFDENLSKKAMEYETRRNRLGVYLDQRLLREEKAIIEMEFLEINLFQILQYSYALLDKESFKDWLEGFEEEVDYLVKLRSKIVIIDESDTILKMRKFIETGILESLSKQAIMQQKDVKSKQIITFFRQSNNELIKNKNFIENVNLNSTINILKLRQERNELSNIILQRLKNDLIKEIKYLDVYKNEELNDAEKNVLEFLKKDPISHVINKSGKSLISNSLDLVKDGDVINSDEEEVFAFLRKPI